MKPIVQKIMDQASQTWKTLEPLLHLKDQKILDQLKSMGLVSKDELQELEERFESRISALETELKKQKSQSKE